MFKILMVLANTIMKKAMEVAMEAEGLLERLVRLMYLDMLILPKTCSNFVSFGGLLHHFLVVLAFH